MKKKKFEWMHRKLDDGRTENAIFIDGEHFDWAVDEESLAEVMASNDPYLIQAAKEDISKHFLDCLSEVVGRKVTYLDVQEAEKTGWI